MTISRLKIPGHTNCKNCGGCCAIIPCTPDEYREIWDFLDENPEIRAVAKLNSSTPEQCPFRDWEQEKCLIYPVRPVICRLMGVTSGMQCRHGNSAEIDGTKFASADDYESMITLNQINW